MMRRAVQSRVIGNIKLLRSRDLICLLRSREPMTLQIQSRQLFGMSRLNFTDNKQRHVENSQIIQGVVFKKRRKRLLDTLIPLGLGCICSMIYNYFVLEPLEQALDDPELPELPDEEIQPIFIPFPLTTKEIKQPSYRGSDPEWQEFVKFSKQQDLAQQVRRDLANIILTAVSKHPMLSLHVGKTMKLRRYWLDVDFPSEPPPEYIQSGIEIGNDYIAWTQQSVDSMTVCKLQRALWPSSMTLSAWSFTKVVVADFIDRLAGMVGFKTEQPPTLEQILARHRQLVKGTKIPPHDGPQLDSQPYPAGVDVAYVPSIRPPDQIEVNSQNESDRGLEEVVTELRKQFSRPLVAFKRAFAKTWREPICHPPRGCISVSGLVEIDTPKAYLVFDVMAHWDPWTKSYHMESLAVSVRRIQLKKQAPRDVF